MKRFPAIILDRDGVLNPTVCDSGSSRAPCCVEEFRYFDGAQDALNKLSNRCKMVVVTNQPRVASGQERREEVEKIHDFICRTTPVIAVLSCFHAEDSNCNCRKPRPGLFFEAAQRFDLDLSRSVSIGDHWVDIAAGQAAGCGQSILILTPSSEADKCQPSVTVADLPEAIRWLLKRWPAIQPALSAS